MPNFTYEIDRSNLKHLQIVLKTETGAKAGVVAVIFDGSSEPQVGPYSVEKASRGNGLSYALLMLGAIQVLNAGFTSMKTGMVHGILHDTMNKAGLTAGQMQQDPTAKNRWKTHGRSRYLEEHGLQQNSQCRWMASNIGKVIATCMQKANGSGVCIAN